MEKTIAVVFVIVLVAMCGCTGGTGMAGATAGAEVMDTLYYPLDSIPSGDEKVHVCSSEDGKMKFYSWMTFNGGVTPDFQVLCQYRTSDGGSKVVSMERTTYVGDVHSLTREDGYTYYIFSQTERISGGEGYTWMVAYTIDSDTLREVSVYDGGDDLDDCGMEAGYATPHWFFATNGEGWDWVFKYDSKTRNLYIPIIAFDNDDRPIISDRYKVYHFNGEGFESMGEHPHKGLHEALNDYYYLASYFKTDSHIIRIDRMHDDSYRFASWQASSGMDEKPDVIVMGGRREENTGVYDFRQDEMEYIVGELEEDESPADDVGHQEYLVVKKEGKVVLKEKKKAPRL